MEVSGEEHIRAPQQAVWDALNDPDVLKACIAGCEAVEKTSATEFRMAMNAAVGPVKARFTGKLAISHADPPNTYILTFEGTGGAAGFGKGSASVSLAPVEGGTSLKYVATAQVGGKIAQVGSRLIDGVAKKMAEDFFNRFSARFPAESPADTRIAIVPEAGVLPTEPPPSSGHAHETWLWIGGCILALVLLGTIFLAR